MTDAAADPIEYSEGVILPEPVDAREILGQHETILLYGEGGTGKTFTAATAPEPQWWLTPGRKREIKTALSKRFIEKHGRREMFITSVVEDRKGGQMTDNPTGYDQCCLALDGFLEWDYKEGIGVKTIIVDNATIIEEYMMNKAIMAEYVMASSKNKTVLTAEREFGIRKPHDSTWGGAQSFMDRWVNWLIELPYHVVFIAHTYNSWEQIEHTRTRRLVGVKPLFVGQQRTNIPNKFDNVWFARVMGGGRSQTWGIQPERDEIILAKTRVGGILDPSYEQDPNLSEIIEQFSQYAKEQEEV
jgi:hypothetical protein